VTKRKTARNNLSDQVGPKRAGLRFPQGLPSPTAPDKTLWEEIDEIINSAPPGTWDSVPADGASQLDHYLHGTPKRPDQTC
jgi:hypothetical protein